MQKKYPVIKRRIERGREVAEGIERDCGEGGKEDDGKGKMGDRGREGRGMVGGR